MTEDNIIKTKDAEPTLDEVTEQTQEEVTNKEESYTQADVDRMISKATESAISKREAKLEAEYEERIEKEKADAIAYQKMTDKEKKDAEVDKRMKALEEREQAINNRELRGQIESDLREHNLPSSLADSLLTLQDNEKIKESITSIKEDFDNAINERVKEALRQDTPDTSTRDTETDPFAAKLKKYQ